MASWSESVRFGLPEEFRPGVTTAVADGLVVTLAAHGEISSSQAMFAILADLLAAFLRDGIPREDIDVWRLYSQRWTAHRGGASTG